MARRHKERAIRMRAWLMDELGNACCHSHLSECVGDLEFDCIHPCGDAHHKGSTDQRMSFYLKQAALGNLQILCRKHNSTKGNALPEPKEQETDPF